MGQPGEGQTNRQDLPEIKTANQAGNVNAPAQRTGRISKAMRTLALLAAMPIAGSCAAESGEYQPDMDQSSVVENGQESKESPFTRFVQPAIFGRENIQVHIHYPKPVFVQVTLDDTGEQLLFKSGGGKEDFTEEMGRVVPGFTIKVALDPGMNEELQIISSEDYTGTLDPDVKDGKAIYGVDKATNGDDDWEAMNE